MFALRVRFPSQSLTDHVLALQTDDGAALPKRASVSHTLSLATIPGSGSRLLGATDAGIALVATVTAAFIKRNACTMQMSVITFSPLSTRPVLITP